MSQARPEVDNSWQDVFPPIVIFFDGDYSEYIQPESNDKDNGEQTDIDQLPLIMKPGTVCWQGLTFELRKEGRYCFCEGCYLKRNIIVYDHDEFAVFKALAQIQVHGHRHNDLSYDEKLKMMQTGSIAITCGEIASFTHELLKDYGFQTRIVNLLTLDEWNGYDNGHVLLEYLCKETGKWRLLDIDTHCLFEAGERFLSLYEFHQKTINGEDYQLHKLTSIGAFDPLSRMSAFCNASYGNETQLRRWFARVMQAVSLTSETDGKRYYVEDDPEKRRRIMSYNKSYNCMETTEWLSLFYGQD